MPSRVVVEAACSSVDDCVGAEAAGANRVELCSALLVGGLTPSIGLFETAWARTALPIVCMVRPRAGAFCYADAELEAMRRDVDALRRAGAAGVVFGALTADGRVDVEACRRLVDAAGPLETIFHRAFDLVAEMDQALDVLIDLGVTRVLTSGGAATALEGAPAIARLIRRAAGRVEILPGGGVRSTNALAVLEATGASSLHLGPSVHAADQSGDANPRVSFGEPGAPRGGYRALDLDAIRHVREALVPWERTQR
jgi:copper homeostasis protein